MDNIKIRYGETVTLPLDTGDVLSVSADIYIGKPGQSYILTKHITLTDGQGTFVLSAVDTAIPLDTYYYQVNVTDGTGHVDKYPAPDQSCSDCDEVDFPEFVVAEALDVNEIS